MGIAAWLVPALLSLASTGISAGVSASNQNKQIEQQEKINKMNQFEQNKSADIQRIQNELTNRMNTQNTVDQFSKNMNNVVTEDPNNQTNYANCGGRFKRLFGGKNKVDRTSIFVSPNNIPVKTDSNTVVQYRDRLAQMRLGGHII